MLADKIRMPCIDAAKAVACLLIVLHHLAVYGPMSDYVYPMMTVLIDGLYHYGRMAVQAFLVIAGFFSAKNLMPFGVPRAVNPLQAITQRYDRLIVPYLAALTLAIICASLARVWMDHEYIPDAPEIPQLLAHTLLLQDLLDQEALSAGVWYVAIDFQLFAVTALLLWLARHRGGQFPAEVMAPVLIGGLTIASLFAFNRNAIWDETALYFFASYGLGVLAYWAATRRQGVLWLILLGTLVAVALMVEFRLRIAIAGVVMLLLGFARRFAVRENRPELKPLTALGRISYSVFLVHFPLCMVVNAVFFRFFPNQPLANILGLVIALIVSIAGGALFFRWVENHPFRKRVRLPVLAGFVTSGFFSMLGSGI